MQWQRTSYSSVRALRAEAVQGSDEVDGNPVIPNARSIEGVVSVGANNRHRHPNAAVMGKIGRYFQPNIEMTMTHGDIVKVL